MHKINACLFRLLGIILFLAMVNSISAASGTTTICKWKGNRTAALSFAIDDNHFSDTGFIISNCKPRGIQVTWFLITGNVKTAPAIDPGWGNWDQWRAIAAQGFAIGSHTVTHPVSLTNVYRTNKSMVTNELRDSRAMIESQIPDNGKVVAIAWPGGTVDSNVVSIASNYYIAGRGVSRSGNLSDYPSSPPINYKAPNYSMWNLGDISAVTYLSNAKVDFIISTGGWGCFFHHGMIVTNKQRYIDGVNYVQSKSNQLWTGGYGDVAQYIYERDASAAALVSSTASLITLNLTHSLRTNVCDFKYPLTLKTEVPSTWLSVKFTQGTNVKTIASVDEAGTRYIYCDAKPNSGQITLSVDSTPPSAIGSLLSPTNTAILFTPTPLFSWTHSTDASGIGNYDINVDAVTNRFGSSTNCSSITVSTGFHSWKVRAVDNFGNAGLWTAPWSFSVIVTNKPTIPNLVSPSNGVSLGTTTPILIWTKSSNLIGIKSYDVNVDVVTNVNILATNFTTTALSLGVHAWKVRAVNNSGIKGLWSASRTFIVDTNSPVAVDLISPTNNANEYVLKPIFNWTASTDFHGVNHYDLVVDAVTNNVGTVTSYTSAVQLAIGAHTWRVRVTDGLLNKGLWTASRFFTIIFTNKPSQVSLISPASSVKLERIPFSFKWTKSIDVLGLQRYEVSVDGAIYNAGLVTNYGWSAPDYGTHSWMVRAVNTAGIYGVWSSPRTFVVALNTEDFIMSPNPVRISESKPIYFYYETVTYPSATILFEIYSVNGERVTVLLDANGSGKVAWNLKNSAEKAVAPGIYLVIMKSKGTVVSLKPKKLGILK